MANEAIDCCRLCSSTTNLISMFKGKSRTIRNSLRKMIQETIQIQMERTDCSSSVCFNCLVDVSNFYNFKLHCIQNNEKLKDIEDSFPNAKKFKQHNEPLDSIEKPDVSLTQNILEWLERKRVNILESSIVLAQTFTDKDCQTSFEYMKDASTQCELKSQESSNKSQTFIDKYSQTSFEYVDAFTQYESKNVERRFKKRSKSIQTDTSKFKNSYCQTNQKKLSQTVFVNNAVFKVSTKARSVQTDDGQQRDIPHNSGINGYKCALPLESLIKNASIPYNLKDNSCQTEEPQMHSLSIQCDLLTVKNSIYSDSCKSPPQHSLKDSKLDLKVSCKEEKLSPLESLSLIIPSIPQKSDSQLSDFSDLLEVKVNKSVCVHICKICDRSLYNRREIIFHNKSHMKCHFCKGNFKSIKFAQNHMRNCKFRRASFVHLTRIDDVSEAKEKYSDALRKF